MVEKETKETIGKKSGWFKESLKLAGWMLLIFVWFIFFYQLLPAVLLAMGYVLMLFGTNESGPSMIDAMVYILTGFSFTSVLTYGFVLVLKQQVKHVRRIRADLSERFANRLNRKKVK